MAKVTKRRMCPALNREITSGDCGENRGSRYACPADCRQPALLQLVMTQLFEGAKSAPNKMRPSMEAQAPMVAVLKVVINEIDHALRGH